MADQRNYDAYIVDGTYGPAFALNAENGPDGSVHDQFKADWGFALEQRVISALKMPRTRSGSAIALPISVKACSGPGLLNDSSQ